MRTRRWPRAVAVLVLALALTVGAFVTGAPFAAAAHHPSPGTHRYLDADHAVAPRPASVAPGRQRMVPRLAGAALLTAVGNGADHPAADAGGAPPIAAPGFVASAVAARAPPS